MPELQTILTYRSDAVFQPNAWRGTGPRATVKLKFRCKHYSIKPLKMEMQFFLTKLRKNAKILNDVVSAFVDKILNVGNLSDR